MDLFTRFSFRRTAVWLGVGALLSTAHSARGQVGANYVFSQTTGTYTPVTGGNLVVANTDPAPGGNDSAAVEDFAYAPVAIPFPFTFNGSVYNSLRIVSNGWVFFGNATSAHSIPISSTDGYSGAIAGFGRDMMGPQAVTADRTSGSNTLTNVSNTGYATVGAAIQGTGIPTGTTITAVTANSITMSAAATSTATGAFVSYTAGEIRTNTIGTAPNRTFIVEFKNMAVYTTGTGTTANTGINFQIQLDEGGGSALNQVIRIVYGNFYATSISSEVEVGLRGATSADFNNRTATAALGWSATTAGTTNAAKVAYTSTALPPSGLTFTWTPATCQAPTAITVSGATGTAATISWNAPTATAPTGYEWEVRSSGAPGSGATGLAASGTTTAPTTSGTASGLTQGITYSVYVRSTCGSSVFSGWSPATTFFSFPAPANNNCAGATTLTPAATLTCGTATPGTTAGATPSGETPPTCGPAGTNDDVWYSFVATATGHRVALTNVAGNVTDMAMSIYSGACGALTHIQCSDPNTMDVTGLTIGQTYSIRVWTWSSAIADTARFDICLSTLPAAPANDDCAGAVTLTVNPNYSCAVTTAGTTISATQSSETAPSCGATGVNDDVWYKFTATSTAHRISLTGITGSVTDMAMSVYSGACGSLTHIQCSDPETMNVTGLTVGQTYTVRVWTWSATTGNSASFNICVGTAPPPPANDNCAGAITLTVNPNYACGTVTTGTTTSATQSTEPAPTCGAANGWNDDVWYQFTATNTAHRITLSNVSGTVTDMAMSIYSGVCGSLTHIQCSDPNTMDVTGLTVGQTYRVRVWTYTATAGSSADFSICVGTPPPPPPNDNCSGAISIATVPNAAACTGIAASTTGATQSSPNPSSCATSSNDDDVWYSFTATANNVVIRFNNMVATSGTATQLGMGLYTGTCGSLTEFAGSCSTGFGTAGSGSRVINNLTIGTTYYLYLFAGGGTNSATFNFCVYDTAICATPLNPTAATTTTTANLSWTQPPTGNQWQIQYGVGNFTLGTGTNVFTGINPYPLPGLTPATGYSYFVRNICGPGDTSAWTARVSFTTQCLPSTLPFTENFAAVPPSTCWSRAQGYLTTAPTSLTTANGSWGLEQYLNNSANGPAARINIWTTSKRDWLITPTLDLGTTPANFIVEFNLGIVQYSTSTTVANPVGTTLGVDDTVAVVVSTDNGATWSSANALRVWTAANTPVSATGSQRYYVPMNGYSGQVKIGFYASEGPTGVSSGAVGDNEVFVDSLRITQCVLPTASLGADTTLCAAGASVTLDAGAGTSYLWNTGATTQTISVSAAGNYSVTVTNGSLGCAKSDTISIFTGTPPVVNLGADAPVCGNVTSLPLDAGNAGASYVWLGDPSINTQTLDVAPYLNNRDQNPGTNNPTAVVPVGVVVTNALGCAGGDTVELTLTFSPRVNAIAVAGTDPTFTFTPVADSFATSYTYDFGDGSPTSATGTHTYATNGIYTVSLIVSNSCGTDTATTTVSVANGTGINDVLSGGTLQLYPNPTASDATLEVSTGLKLRGLQVMSATGQVVMNRTLDGGSRTTLNTSSLAPGVYTLRIQLDKGVVVRKLEVIK